MTPFMSGFADELTKVAAFRFPKLKFRGKPKGKSATPKLPSQYDRPKGMKPRTLAQIHAFNKAEAQKYFKKTGAPKISPEAIEKLKAAARAVDKPARKIGRGAVGIGLLHKLIDPDVSASHALRGGLGATVGSMAGSEVAKRVGAGGRARLALGLGGTILGLRAVRSSDKAKAKRRAEKRRRDD